MIIIIMITIIIIIRYNALNGITQRSLNRASITTIMKSIGLLRTDSKCPNGLTLVLWREGRCLVWNITVADTAAKSSLQTVLLKQQPPAKELSSRNYLNALYSYPRHLQILFLNLVFAILHNIREERVCIV